MQIYRKKSKMGKKDAIIILIAVALLAFTATIWAYSYLKIISVNQFEITLSIGDRIGFDLGSQEISFGTMLPGSTASRTIKIENNEEFPLKVIVKHFGDTNKFVSIDKNNFVMLPEESGELNFLAEIPKNAEHGNYTGKVIIRTIKI